MGSAIPRNAKAGVQSQYSRCSAHRSEKLYAGVWKVLRISCEARSALTSSEDSTLDIAEPADEINVITEDFVGLNGKHYLCGSLVKLRRPPCVLGYHT